jgi:signal transduction histidine kinase
MIKTGHLSKTLVAVIIIAGFVVILAVFILVSLSRWENKLIEENKLLCKIYGDELFAKSKEAIDHLGSIGFITATDLTTSQASYIDSVLKKCSSEQLALHDGLDGGFFIYSLNSFFGYAFPTSPPPVPAYGPPPRSFEIIRFQCIETIDTDSSLIRLHEFDPALFPLATVPIIYDSIVVGSVWVRTHLENYMPMAKISKLLNRTAIIALAGLFLFLIVAALFRGEMQGLKSEMANIRDNPGYRMKNRWGVFGYISATINDMLSIIEAENISRQKLETKLNQRNKMASLGAMVSGVAHEVKTPLSIIKTRLQIWDKSISSNGETNGSVTHESLQMMVKEADRLSSLVNRLLAFSRPIESKLKLSDINSHISEAVNFFRMDIANKNIEIELLLRPDLPLIPLDQSTMKQVLFNILENSRDSMPDGGLITVESGLVPGEECLFISVVDTGIGIPEEALDRIFDPFFTLKETGVGLGLAISCQIIKAHGGEITITNNNGGGTRCMIQLPIDYQKI